MNLKKYRAKQDRVRFAQLVGMEPDPWQIRFLRSDAKRKILNCSRQVGKSTTTAILTLHTALFEPETLSLVLAPSERQAKEFFSKVMEFYQKLGYKVSSRSERKLGLALDNGSRIEALPGTEKTIRGFSGVRLLILDEASRVPDGLYYAVRPMLAVSDGDLVMLSSPYGKRGVFYEEWHSSGDWDRYEITALDSPRIPPMFLEEERQNLPRLVFDQEYMCKFTDTDEALFHAEEIDAAMRDNVLPLFAER